MSAATATVQETITQATQASGGLGALWTALIGVVLVAALYEYWRRSSREYRMTKNIPSPPELPVLGNAHLVLGCSNAEIVAKGNTYLEQYGETLRAWLGHVLVVFLTNPNDIEIILSSNNHLDKAEEYRYFKPWFGDGLLISSGNHWRHHRKMIAPTFHQSILKSFVPTFVKHSKNVVDRMSKELGKEFDIHDYMSQTTVEILLTTAMGVKKIPEGNKSFEYAKAVVDMCDIIHKRQVKMMYRLDAIYNMTKMRQKGDKMMDIILGMTRRVVMDRKANYNAEGNTIVEEFEEPLKKTAAKKVGGLRDDLDDIDENDVGAKRRLALLDAMVEMAKNPEIEWNEKDIMDEVNTIMFEGHDTTSAGSSFALCMMGMHKDVQEKVFAEQKAIFGENLLRDCTFADTMEMKYLERVIMETLRMYPPVPLIARRLDSDVKLASGPYCVPKGTTVVVLQYRVHRRPDIYANPDKFDPDNFLPERMANRHYYSFIPFSAGPRSCVGRKYAMLKLKVLLSTIIRNYTVHSNETEADWKLQADIILKLENGFNVVLEKRQPVVASRRSVYCSSARSAVDNTAMDTLELLNTTRIATNHVALAKERILPNPLYITLIGVVLAITLYDIWYRHTDVYKKLRTIPGPPILPLIGNAHLLVGLTPTEIVQKALIYMNRYGETISGCFFNFRLVFLTNPADIEIILNSHVHLEKSYEYKFFQPWFGDGLLISKGNHWRYHRKMIAPTFHQSILKSFVPTFVKHSQNITQQFEQKLLGQEFDVHAHMSQTTVEILLSTAMGMKNLPTGKECAKYAEAVIEMCDVIQKRQTKPHYHFDAIYRLTKLRQKCDRMMNIILTLTKRVIAERRENFNLETDGVLDQQDALNEVVGKKKEVLRDDLDDIDEEENVGAKRRLALLDTMVELAKNPSIQWTDKDVMDEVNTILFEGHDTTSAGSSFTLCLLGIHKDVQERVFQEQTQIFADNLQRDCTFADAQEMHYLERVIKETLRLYPPVPVIARKVNEDVPLASGPYIIPKGTTVVIGQYAVHRRPECYENPEKFDPDNFLPENMAKRHYYSYVPFSAGPRSCVGRKYAMLMLKILLSTLVRKFHIHSNVDESQFDLQGDIILKLANGFKVVLTLRDV
ncbi:uncharacterized protein LOC129237145 [Anastrepha obliqua]|uniref:uncharacterized protein LOC129237145 n=1 Tax=Anastrepha obliqua TaxID=95512 RepID=UPI00240A2E3E|nr:uncharacterized protein LOC129237145 [Anastrepha obliqua]